MNRFKPIKLHTVVGQRSSGAPRIGVVAVSSAALTMATTTVGTDAPELALEGSYEKRTRRTFVPTLPRAVREQDAVTSGELHVLGHRDRRRLV